jgi:DNA-binding FadR family transcriptional regulator
LLIAASGNAFLAALSSSVTAAVAWSTIFKERTRRLRRDPVPDHRRVFDAIAASDPANAHKAMTRLLELALADIMVAPARRK